MKNAVIFDMDGVLVDSEYEYLKRLEGFLISNNELVTLEDLSPMAGADDVAMWDILETILNKPLDHNKVKQQFSLYLKEHPVIYADIVNDGVRDILNKLKNEGYKLALASSSKMEHISLMLDSCSLRSFFDVILSGEMFEKTKPDPAIYNKAVAMLELEKDDCIVIEDSPIGITAAKAAGLYTMAKKETRFTTNQSEADCEFITYEEAYCLIHKKNS